MLSSRNKQLLLLYKDYNNLQFALTNFFVRRNVVTQSVVTEWDEAKPFEAIPGPKPLPIIGNIWRYLPVIGEYYGKNYYELYKELQKKFGNLVIMNGLPGRDPIVLTYNVNDIEMMYRNEGARPTRPGLDSFKHYRTEVRKDFYKIPSIVISQGEEWYKVRSKVNPIFMKPQAIKRYTNTIQVVVDEFINRIDNLVANDKNSELPADFINELFKWSLETTYSVVLNLRLGCLSSNLSPDSDAQKMINAAVDMFDSLYKLDVLPSLWKYFSTPQYKKMIRTNNFIQDFIKKKVDIAEAQLKNNPHVNPDEEPSILEKLLAIDNDIACVMIHDALIAAIETTSKTTATALYYLAINEEKQENLREELKAIWPDASKPLTVQQMDQMTYLRACIKESQRLSPVIFGNIRVLDKDVVMSGYQIPKNTHIMAINIVLCRSEEHFPQPDKYIPERWLRDSPPDISTRNINHFVFLPFGHGPRTCVGRRLAMHEIEIFLAKLLRNNKLSWNYGPMKWSNKLLFEVADPLKFQVTPLR